MEIIKATFDHVPEIVMIYDSARAYMRKCGNMHQWNSDYPGLSSATSDIENESLYLCIDDSGEILGVFFFQIGNDKTYEKIYSGAWLNDEPYGVVHRIAVSDGARGKGVASFCLDFALKMSGNLKIDTHSDNYPMQNMLFKNGFQKCGIIYLENKDERIAFQKYLPK